MSLSEKLGWLDTLRMNNLPMTEAAVMSWLDLNTPILPLRKFLSAESVTVKYQDSLSRVRQMPA